MRCLLRYICGGAVRYDAFQLVFVQRLIVLDARGDLTLELVIAHAQRPAAEPGSRGMRLVQTVLHEPLLDALFAAAAEATEAAVVNALFAATDVIGRDGTQRIALTTLAPDWRALLATQA